MRRELKAYTAAFERQNKELKTDLIELEIAWRTKSTKAVITTL
jgi:hypothetical protein